VDHLPGDTKADGDLGGSYELAHVDLPTHAPDGTAARTCARGVRTFDITAAIAQGEVARPHSGRTEGPALRQQPGPWSN
jgi:hypothetical protein